MAEDELIIIMTAYNIPMKENKEKKTTIRYWKVTHLIDSAYTQAVLRQRYMETNTNVIQRIQENHTNKTKSKVFVSEQTNYQTIGNFHSRIQLSNAIYLRINTKVVFINIPLLILLNIFRAFRGIFIFK